MNQALLLFAFRLVSAGILLALLGGMAWLVYQDLRMSAATAAEQHQALGHLRVVVSEERGPSLDTLFPLLPVTSIGRAQGNTVVIDDGYVSSEHVMISRRGKQLWIEDLGSRNGTLLNDLPLTETTVVSSGDIITVGGAKLKIELAQRA
ncbi:MAG: FHA domain-containing protein [Anaerolineaceae bacterium]|nr:MAG: FHA domain-containing protein [Anaerolineaceae bacterium]